VGESKPAIQDLWWSIRRNSFKPKENTMQANLTENCTSQDCAAPQSANQQCGLFDFMANMVGLKVLHPGGYKSTDELCATLAITERSHVLDVACGTGTTALRLSDKFNCQVTGFDMAANLIEIAQASLKSQPRAGKIKFEVANALQIPYPENSFDVVLSQAFFILIDEKEQALKEIVRVLKPGGYFGSLELGWFKSPPQAAYEELVEKTCNSFIPRVVGFDQWEAFFRSAGLKHLATKKYPMTSSMLEMFATEGFANSLKVMLKMLGNSSIRTRMMNVQKTFGKYNDYLGYGIFSYQKA
jgi:ubiquinone/menaquinone biosynthesis C-methylase UbiE